MVDMNRATPLGQSDTINHWFITEAHRRQAQNNPQKHTPFGTCMYFVYQNKNYCVNRKRCLCNFLRLMIGVQSILRLCPPERRWEASLPPCWAYSTSVTISRTQCAQTVVVPTSVEPFLEVFYTADRNPNPNPIYHRALTNDQ